MTLSAKILISAVALLQTYFLVLEMFLWTKAKGLKTFGMQPAFAAQTARLAANQGLYNGFLAAGLFWSLLHPDLNFGRQIAVFFLGCVIVAGIYGAYSVNKKILFVQALPACLALLTLFI